MDRTLWDTSIVGGDAVTVKSDCVYESTLWVVMRFVDVSDYYNDDNDYGFQLL